MAKNREEEAITRLVELDEGSGKVALDEYERSALAWEFGLEAEHGGRLNPEPTDLTATAKHLGMSWVNLFAGVKHGLPVFTPAEVMLMKAVLCHFSYWGGGAKIEDFPRW